MKTRIFSSLVLIPLLYAVYSGGYILKAAGIIIGVLALREFYNAFKAIEIKAIYSIGVFCSILLYVFDLLDMIPSYYSLWFFIITVLILLFILKTEGTGIKDGAITLLGIFYVIFLSYHVIMIDEINHYRYFVWLVFITALVTDTAAYFTGYICGKHKLWPEISPKKTIEGAIGGVVGSLIISMIFGYVMAPQLLVHFAVIGIIGSLAGQIGDLIASAFKRATGIKDFGDLIPGHGGVLDRFDSILMTAPIIYYYIQLFIN